MISTLIYRASKRQAIIKVRQEANNPQVQTPQVLPGLITNRALRIQILEDAARFEIFQARTEGEIQLTVWLSGG